MNVILKSSVCALLAAALALPLPAFANSLHLASKVREQASANNEENSPLASAPAQPGEPLKLPAEEQDTDTKDASPEQLNAITGLTVGSERSDRKGNLLVIPEGTEDASFLAGSWGFTKLLVRPDGTTLCADFSFDRNGQGFSSFVDEKGVRHQAESRAFVSDGVLKIQTSPYTSSQSSETYYPQFVECRNQDGSALCSGTDGFSSWEGERLLGEAAQAASQSEAQTLPEAQGSAEHANLTELSSDGAELPPAVLEEAEKAKLTSKENALSALSGDWRYSRDLAKKKDGSPVALEFHFDDAGKGYSVIREGSGQEYKAKAEAQAMADGSIRVKTDVYGNGGNQAYFPTFMECQSGKAAELLCDVSNGWTRVEDGFLISKKSLEEQERRVNIEELLPTASEESSSAETQSSGVDIAGMLAEMSESSSSASSSSQRSSASTSSSQSESLRLPPKADNMSFLEGRWRCETGLARVSDNQPIVLEFSFDKNGKGSAFIVEQDGTRYDASARASYVKGTLRVNTSEFRSKKSRGAYSKSKIECRDQGGHALCNGEDGGATWSNAQFIRLK